MALGLGLGLSALLASWQVGLDLIWSGVGGGTIAYAVHRFAKAAKARAAERGEV